MLLALLDFSVFADLLMIFLNQQRKSLEREAYYLQTHCTHFYLVTGHVTE